VPKPKPKRPPDPKPFNPNPVQITLTVKGTTDRDPHEWAEAIARTLQVDLNEYTPVGWPRVSVTVDTVTQ
jgi:hypothetical protein